ncbi:uncharacterized protein LOC108003963 [Apis cerana]|uniref:Essential protein Yae1 N-terminal domain-containing protein n=1 Tax=Apis cerana cerana TaxID=94128 RepID=A0A2A3ES19_APICC|nr:uncharacterized protein LOC108003963 [Apis cerana]PBC33919.1 hypothetical protein APICC_00095 [Apis cerana cerana]
MENSINELDIEDSLKIASKEWNRIINAATKDGYREGIEDGSNSVFQESFNNGYKEGFQIAFILGKFKSLLNIISRDVEHPQNINEILDKIKRGICHICVTEFQNINDQKIFSEIINEQRSYSLKVLQTLYQYFQPYVKQLNINESDILKIQNFPELKNN